ncbi:MAG TPA: hypothetical protein VNJ07_10055 [Chitinophagales bacterium]|nr:hypothetical protein [Chitinophagales bacterium]
MINGRFYSLGVTVYNWSFRLRKLLIVLLLPFYVLSQTPDYKLIKSIPLTATFLSSDKLGNGYVVNEKNELLKFNPQGELLYSYTNKSLGHISFAGTTNPLKILVYYPDFSTIITLDNTLSETGRINLFELGSNKVSAACVALDNNIWIYDEVLFKLRKFDDKLGILTESDDLNVLQGSPVKANFLLEKDNFLYLNDTALGILVFDTYATYYKTIPLKGLSGFQKVQEQLIYFRDGKLFSYHLQTFATSEITLPGNAAVYAVVEKERLFLLRKNQLDVYSY